MFLFAVFAVLIGDGQHPDLAPPFPVMEKAGRGIDVTEGHAAPAWYDLTGDGLEDLVLGQFGDGQVRLYPNRGERGRPRFGDFEWIRVGKEPAQIESG